MFRFLYKPVFRVLIFSTLLICTAKLSGLLLHDPLILLFTNPDGSRCEMPCLLGIRPGETTFQDAMTLVQNHPMTYNLRLFEGDFTGIPTGIWWPLFHSPKWSVLFMGQGGHAVALQIYEGRYEGHMDAGIDYQVPVHAVCFKSVVNNATVELPPISPELALMWHKTSFLQMVATLGEPQSISSPVIASTGASFADKRLESFYFDDHLVITHTNDTPRPPGFIRNFFDSVCIYAVADFNSRFNTGFHGRSGAVVPWLGMYASTQDYLDWMAENPAIEPVPVMP